jgi:DNA-binding transcriptional ArsR family regulator
VAKSIAPAPATAGGAANLAAVSSLGPRRLAVVPEPQQDVHDGEPQDVVSAPPRVRKGISTHPKFRWHSELLDADLHPTRKFVALAVWERTELNGGDGYPGEGEIAERFKLSTRTVRTHLKALRESGWLVRTQHGGRLPTGERKRDVYTLGHPYLTGSQDAEAVAEPTETTFDRKPKTSGPTVTTGCSTGNLITVDRKSRTSAYQSSSNSPKDDDGVREPMEDEEGRAKKIADGIVAKHLGVRRPKVVATVLAAIKLGTYSDREIEIAANKVLAEARGLTEGTLGVQLRKEKYENRPGRFYEF